MAHKTSCAVYDPCPSQCDCGESEYNSHERCRREISALKEQVGQLQTIIDEEAKDSGAVILERDALKEQVAQLERDVEFTTEARVKDYKQLKETIAELKEQVDLEVTARKQFEKMLHNQAETIAQQAEALRVKDEALDWCVGEFDLRLDDIDLSKETKIVLQALAIQPNTDILRERDARLVERIADRYEWLMVKEELSELIDQIRKGTWK